MFPSGIHAFDARNARHRTGRHRQGRRGGLTAVELLVSIGVISLLAALLLPAIQRARESQRRVSCVSHLRQMGQATEAYVSARQQYPRSPMLPHGPPRLVPYLGLSTHVLLLPYLEQEPLYSRIDPNLTRYVREAGEPPVMERQAELLNQPVPVFVCPSDDVPVGGNSYRTCNGTTPGIHATWAPGRPLPPDDEPQALFGVMLGARRPEDVRDGLSQTILFSERVVGDLDTNAVTAWRDVFKTEEDFYTTEDAYRGCTTLTDAVGHYSFAGRTWLFADYMHTEYNHVLPPNAATPDCFAYTADGAGEGAMSARSFHTGGVNVCLADGSVRFVSEAVDLSVWRAAATVHRGETVALP